MLDTSERYVNVYFFEKYNEYHISLSDLANSAHYVVLFKVSDKEKKDLRLFSNIYTLKITKDRVEGLQLDEKDLLDFLRTKFWSPNLAPRDGFEPPP